MINQTAWILSKSTFFAESLHVDNMVLFMFAVHNKTLWLPSWYNTGQICDSSDQINSSLGLLMQGSERSTFTLSASKTGRHKRHKKKHSWGGKGAAWSSINYTTAFPYPEGMFFFLWITFTVSLVWIIFIQIMIALNFSSRYLVVESKCHIVMSSLFWRSSSLTTLQRKKQGFYKTSSKYSKFKENSTHVW